MYICVFQPRSLVTVCHAMLRFILVFHGEFRRCKVKISDRSLATMTDISRDFTQSLQVSVRTLP